MTNASTPASFSAGLGPAAEYVADTGPLLCLGDFKTLRDVFKSRCHGKTHWVEAVRLELVEQAKRNDHIARAARQYSGKGASWLTAPISFTADDELEMQVIRSRLKVLAEEKAKRKGQEAPEDHEQKHLGETQSILHVSRNTYILLTHDSDAHVAARERGLRSSTLVDVGRQLLAEGIKGVTARVLADGFMTSQARGIFPGKHITGPLDLSPGRIPQQRRPKR